MRKSKNPLPTDFSAMIGRRMRWLRELNDLTLAEVEERSGVTAKTLQRYERGGLDISTNAIQAVAEALNTRPSVLCGSLEGFCEAVSVAFVFIEQKNGASNI